MVEANILPIDDQDKLSNNIYERLKMLTVAPELTGIKCVSMDGCFVIYVTLMDGTLLDVVVNEVGHEMEAILP